MDLKYCNIVMGRAKKGGAVLGKGAFGCVVDSVPKCDSLVQLKTTDKNSKRTVAKIFKNKDQANVEWSESMNVAKINGSAEWSVPVYKQCTVSAKELNQKDRVTCDIPENATVTYITMDLSLIHI